MIDNPTLEQIVAQWRDRAYGSERSPDDTVSQCGRVLRECAEELDAYLKREGQASEDAFLKGVWLFAHWKAIMCARCIEKMKAAADVQLTVEEVRRALMHARWNGPFVPEKLTDELNPLLREKRK